MQEKAKSNSVVTTQVREDGAIVFTVLGAGTIVFDPASAHDANRTRAMRQGFVQRIVNAAAIPRDTTNGKPAAPADKFAAMKALADHLASGSEAWGPARAGGKAKAPELDPIMIAAIAEATGKDPAAVCAHIKSLAENRKVKESAILAVLGATAKVQPILERLRAEAAESAGLDGDDLLEGLGEEE
jgi:hypothetical protein